ncbi:MAG: peptidylprolyl isomerase [Aquaticitalea sp.]
MLKQLLFTSLFVSSMCITAQNNFEKELDSIQDESQAAKFIETHKANKGMLYVFNKEKHKTQLAKDLFKIGKGGSKVVTSEIDKTHYKVIDKYEIPYHRYSYVYLDGRDKSDSDMKALQNKIVSKYNNGFRIKDLAKMYSMDANANRGGDLGWFTQGKSTTELEETIINENGGKDIFTLEFPDKQAYYVVVRTQPTKFIEEIKVLQVTEAK